MTEPLTIPWDGHGDATDTAAQVAAALTAGSVVVLPTDTVYGVAALPRDRAATDLLFRVKGRGPDTPLAVLCADLEQAAGLCEPAAAHALTVADDLWWPGPLTLVLPRREGVHLYLGEPISTIGIRIPDHALVQAVARLVGPIAVSSANRHGEPTPTTAREAAASLGSEVSLVVDGGPLAASASTVVDATASTWAVRREGPISAADVLAHAPGDAGR